MPHAHNLLCYGDNLDILKRYVDDESGADYNVLFAERSG